MKRSALALGASVLALALTAGPAAADPGVGQVVGDSTAAAQVGAVSVDAPVRVLSDGDSATTGASTGGPQTTTETTGGAQVTSADVNAPVRVLSDGNDAEVGASAGGDESTTDSTGSAQVGATDVDAPVRVASDGDNASDTGAETSGPEQSAADSSGSAQVGSPSAAAPVRVFSDGDNSTSDAGAGLTAGEQTVGESNGTAQVGSPSLFAPVRVLTGGIPGGGTTPGDEPGLPDPEDLLGELEGLLLGDPSGGGDVVAAPADAAPGAEPSGAPSLEDLRRLLDGSDPDPALLAFVPDDGGSVASGEAGVLGVAAESLPVTGADIARMLALGLMMLSSGLALRLVPGGKRR
jgi:hypothetical protein